MSRAIVASTAAVVIVGGVAALIIPKTGHVSVLNRPSEAGKTPATVAASSSPPGASTLPGQIVFGTGPASPAFGEMNPDGAGIRPLPLPVGPLCCGAPALSPDGTKVVFLTEGALELARADGTHGQVIASTGVGSFGWPAWSPSGDQIAFAYTNNPQLGPWEIDIINADGSGRRVVTSGPELAGATETGGLAWSPDGSELAFVPSSGSIEVTSTSGGAPSAIFGPNQGEGTDEEVGSLSWAPGTSLLFAEVGQLPTGIWEINPDGTGLSSVLPGASSPSWGPDGVHFLAIRNGRMVVTTPNGGAQAPIGPTGVDYARWGGPSTITSSVTPSPTRSEGQSPGADVVRSFFARLGQNDFSGAAALVLADQRSCFLADYTTFPVHITLSSVQVLSVTQEAANAIVEVKLDGHARTPFGNPRFPSGVMRTVAVGGTWYVDYEHSVLFRPPCLG